MFAIDYLPLKWGYDHSTRCVIKFIWWGIVLTNTSSCESCFYYVQFWLYFFMDGLLKLVYDVWTLSLKLCVQWKIVRLTVEINKNNKKKRHEHFSFMFKKNFLCQSSIMIFPATKQCSTPRMPILNNLRTT